MNTTTTSIAVSDQKGKEIFDEFTVSFTRHPFVDDAYDILPDSLLDIYFFLLCSGADAFYDLRLGCPCPEWNNDLFRFETIQNYHDDLVVAKVETLAIIRELVDYRRASGLHLLLCRIFDPPVSYQTPETHTLDLRNLPSFLAMDALNLSRETMDGMSKPVIPDHDWEDTSRSVPIEENVRAVYRALVPRASQWTPALVWPEYKRGQ